MSYSSRRPVRATVLAAVAALTAACVPPAATPSSAPTPIPPQSYGRRDRAVVLGMRRLATAIQSGDVGTVILSFDADAEVVTFKGDTLRGRPAVRFVVDLSKDSTHQLAIVPGKVLICTDGSALEFGGKFFGPRDERRQRDDGNYGIVWDAHVSPAVITRMVMTFEDRSLDDIAPCQAEYSSLAAQHSWDLTVELSPHPSGPSAAAQQIRTALTANDFAFRAPYSAESGPALAGFPQASTDHELLVSVGLRHRFTGAVTAELQLGTRPSDHAFGFDGRCESQPCDAVVGIDAYSRRTYIEVNGSPVTLSALLQYQFRSVRVSAGPSIMRGNWKVLEETREIDFIGNAGRGYYGASNWGDINEHDGVTVRSSGMWMGAAAEIAAFLPVSRFVLAEAFVRASAFPNTTLPVADHFQNVVVSNRLIQAGLAVGVGR